jgi:endonuclease/exonuclease/phosphatase (EEP) superfamily protein YafD
VAKLQQPVLLAGDLNATPWSTGMRALTAGELRFGSRQSPWKPTWSVRSPFAIPIDHALSTAPLLILERRVGPDLGSDHRPLELSVAWSARRG